MIDLSGWWPVLAGKSRRAFGVMHWEGEETSLLGAGHHLFWWRLGALPKPDELDGFFAEGDGVRRALVRS